jgi:methyl-accepting chemotaxis protein
MPIEAIQVGLLDKALNPAVTAAATTLPQVDTSNKNATSPYPAENGGPNTPSNVPIYATGNAAKAQTGLKKSNETVAHACDSSTYVGGMIKQVGAYGGQIIQAIRNAIKAILKALGFNPAANGLVSDLKKLAKDIKATSKFVKDITDAIQGYILYVNAIKKLINYILTLPARLLAYFKDCIATLRKQLVAGFKSALDNTPLTESTKELENSIKEVQGSIKEFNNNVQSLVQTTGQLTTSLTNLNQTPVANTQAQAEVTQQVFQAAGFASTTNNFSKP